MLLVAEETYTLTFSYFKSLIERVCRSSSSSLTYLLALSVKSSSVNLVLLDLNDILKRVAYVTVILYRVPTGKFILQFGALFLWQASCCSMYTGVRLGSVGLWVGLGHGSISSHGSGLGWSGQLFGGLG